MYKANNRTLLLDRKNTEMMLCNSYFNMVIVNSFILYNLYLKNTISIKEGNWRQTERPWSHVKISVQLAFWKTTHALRILLKNAMLHYAFTMPDDIILEYFRKLLWTHRCIQVSYLGIIWEEICLRNFIHELLNSHIKLSG